MSEDCGKKHHSMNTSQDERTPRRGMTGSTQPSSHPNTSTRRTHRSTDRALLPAPTSAREETSTRPQRTHTPMPAVIRQEADRVILPAATADRQETSSSKPWRTRVPMPSVIRQHISTSKKQGQEHEARKLRTPGMKPDSKSKTGTNKKKSTIPTLVKQPSTKKTPDFLVSPKSRTEEKKLGSGKETTSCKNTSKPTHVKMSLAQTDRGSPSMAGGRLCADTGLVAIRKVTEVPIVPAVNLVEIPQQESIVIPVADHRPIITRQVGQDIISPVPVNKPITEAGFTPKTPKTSIPTEEACAAAETSSQENASRSIYSSSQEALHEATLNYDYAVDVEEEIRNEQERDLLLTLQNDGRLIQEAVHRLRLREQKPSEEKKEFYHTDSDSEL